MKILLSIKPEYSEKILSGEKKYEFRKTKPRGSIEKIFIYESHPTKHIVGWFTIKGILSGTPDIIWEKCKKESGIEEDRYFNYCEDNNIIHAFEIETLHQYNKPINPFKMMSGFKPPQNFLYLENTMLHDKLER